MLFSSDIRDPWSLEVLSRNGTEDEFGGSDLIEFALGVVSGLCFFSQLFVNALPGLQPNRRLVLVLVQFVADRVRRAAVLFDFDDLIPEVVLNIVQTRCSNFYRNVLDARCGGQWRSRAQGMCMVLGLA